MTFRLEDKLMKQMPMRKTKKSYFGWLRLRIFAHCMMLFALFFSGFVRCDAHVENRLAPVPVEDEADFAAFEAHLESIRQALKIPGMSAAVVRDQELIWAKGFGYADLGNQIAATPDTPYGLASVTKPVAAVLLMQLAEEGLIDLGAPISQYGVNLLGDAVTVRHLLTHTSEGTPGTTHHYNGSRYGYLAGVIEGATGKTFATLLSERVLLPLGMENTALNPMSLWGGPSSLGFDNLKLTLGWGAEFQNYPDVYARLARPYQLDGDYNIVPGMYQLYHNTGAGMLSSVSDLAKFDIALDQGLLLGDAAKTELHTPAYSTYENRQDLNYGLGWYVQDFGELRLLWHTGRWSPSTSALYLKVPEKNLTLIVLANTANLTTPFNGVGSGDVTKSTLTLSFFRHFVFPEYYGYSVPVINWGEGETELLEQLAEVKDETTRRFLERELWSFRQAYASAGQFDQADKLYHVRARAFPQSTFRKDWMFTQTAGPNTVVPPATRASAFVWFSWGMVLWFALVCISVIWMIVHLLCTAQHSRWTKLLWLGATLFLGPVSILIHHLSQSGFDEGKATEWQQAWRASALIVTGYSVAWVIAIALLMSLGSNPHPLMTLGLTYLLPLLLVLSFVYIPLLHRQVKPMSWHIVTRSFLAEVITLNLGYAVFFPLTMLLGDRLLSQIPHPTSPFFWAMISFIAVMGVIILAPLQYWMLRHGHRLPSGLAMDEANGVLPPARAVSWPALLTTSVIMIAALAVTIAQLV